MKNKGTKKHITQMTEMEEDFLKREFASTSMADWKFTPYCQWRFDERGIDPEQFVELFTHSRLIEYHRVNGTDRILMRGTKSKDDFVVCAVFDLTNKNILTVWKNWEKNNHQGMDWTRYNKKADIISMYGLGK